MSGPSDPDFGHGGGPGRLARKHRALRSRVGLLLPRRLREHLRRRFPADPTTPPVGRLHWGDLRRTTPISRDFGYDRGTPVDRYYIERFLAEHAGDITGRVLEVKDAGYTRRFGGSRVTRSDVLDIDPDNPHATIVCDLNDARELPSDAYDCIVLTQVLILVYDYRAALRELRRSLKPGGVILVTVPSITPVAHAELGDTWYWTFTRRGMERLLVELFPPDRVEAEAYGNVLAATAFLQGLSLDELRRDELDFHDPHYQVIVAARAAKPGA